MILGIATPDSQASRRISHPLSKFFSEVCQVGIWILLKCSLFKSRVLQVRTTRGIEVYTVTFKEDSQGWTRALLDRSLGLWCLGDCNGTGAVETTESSTWLGLRFGLSVAELSRFGVTFDTLVGRLAVRLGLREIRFEFEDFSRLE